MEANPLIGIGGLIGGFILNFFLKIGYSFIDEKFQKRKEARLFKRAMADQLTAFCVEAEENEFYALPNNPRHINRIADDIDSIDQGVGGKLRMFLDLWVKSSTLIGPQFKQERIKVCKELKEVAREWKK